MEANDLKNWMKVNEITSKELARILGVSPSWIFALRVGAREIPVWVELCCVFIEESRKHGKL